MPRPEFLNCIMPVGVIQRIRSDQEVYDRDPEAWERNEKAAEERRQEEEYRMEEERERYERQTLSGWENDNA